MRQVQAPAQERHNAPDNGQPITGPGFEEYKKNYISQLGRATNEQVIIAYAGFQDRRDARRWFLSAPIVEAIRASFASGCASQFAKAMLYYERHHQAWEEKSDEYTLAWAEKECPVSFRMGKNVINSDGQTNSIHMLAFLLWWIPRESDRYCNSSPEAQREEYEAVKSKQPWRLPDWDQIAHVEIASPGWTHREDHVKQAERCCRVFGMLRLHWTKIGKVWSGQQAEGKTLADKSQWYWEQSNVFDSVPVVEASKPAWTRETMTLDRQIAKPKPKPISELRPRKIKFVLASFEEHVSHTEIDLKDEEEKAGLEASFKKANRVSMKPSFTEPCRYDPRDMKSGDFWRDVIRLHFELKKAEMYLVSLSVPIVHNGATHLLKFYWRGKQYDMNWDQFLQRIEEAGDETMEIHVCLQAPDEDDDYVPFMEYSGSVVEFLEG
jgi:hypothetical protein